MSVLTIGVLLGLPVRLLLCVLDAGSALMHRVRFVLIATPAGPPVLGDGGLGGRVGVAHAASVVTWRCVPVR